MKVHLIHYTPLEIVELACSIPYQSIPSKKLVKKVWESGHRSVARHTIIVFLVKDVSQSLLRQISRHPHINLTVKSSRYCNMESTNFVIPNFIKTDNAEEYKNDLTSIMNIYRKWNEKEGYTKSQNRELAKMFLPLASTTDLIVSGNYQAMYEFLQLRNCQRAEWEIRKLANTMTEILKKEIPEIFEKLGCKGDELGYCPETKGCGKYNRGKMQMLLG
ncbi:MAG: FAD-dependent thymidylate synthase [Thermosipho sp. (in: Bacteria)]|nr:FAD-dependent thymidylate synthase [Thermosipho sp. (in: thermotogales)]